MNNAVEEKMVENKWIKRISDLDLRKNFGDYIKIGIVSETTGFFICRNNEATEITSEEFENEERVLVPAQKWRGAERSYLLSELRKVGGLIPTDYKRNMVKEKIFLKSPSSLIFGDTSIGSGNEMASIASRTFYDWAYGYEPLGLVSTRQTHNSLSEEGTILHDEKGKTLPNAIYNIQYIKPGVKFIRYITMENSSIEMLQFQLMAILGTTRYGGRTAILGDNIKNKIVAIGFSKGDTTVSSFTTMKEAWKLEKYEPEKLVEEVMTRNYNKSLIKGDEIEKLMDGILILRNDKEEIKRIGQQLIAKMESDWPEIWR
ncbi:MAG: type I-D CRISPR-associated protein Cas7/Csc2 [Thermoplasmataceae archaeon]